MRLPAAVAWYPAQFSEAATFIRPTSAKASVSRRSFKESAKVRRVLPPSSPQQATEYLAEENKG